MPGVGSGRIPLEDIVSGVGDFMDLFFVVKAVAAFDRWAGRNSGVIRMAAAPKMRYIVERAAGGGGADGAAF